MLALEDKQVTATDREQNQQSRAIFYRYAAAEAIGLTIRQFYIYHKKRKKHKQHSPLVRGSEMESLCQYNNSRDS